MGITIDIYNTERYNKWWHGLIEGGLHVLVNKGMFELVHGIIFKVRE